MTSAERQLAMIGYGKGRDEPVCWRAVRLGPAVFPARGPGAPVEPGCSRALLRWRDLLARDKRPSPYRISRIG